MFAWNKVACSTVKEKKHHRTTDLTSALIKYVEGVFRLYSFCGVMGNKVQHDPSLVLAWKLEYWEEMALLVCQNPESLPCSAFDVILLMFGYIANYRVCSQPHTVLVGR